ERERGREREREREREKETEQSWRQRERERQNRAGDRERGGVFFPSSVMSFERGGRRGFSGTSNSLSTPVAPSLLSHENTHTHSHTHSLPVSFLSGLLSPRLNYP